MTPTTNNKVLAIITSAAGGLEDLLAELVLPHLELGWTVTVTATPTAATWLRHSGDDTHIATVTGYPVRSQPRLPTEPSPFPEPTCYAVIPATANTIAKMALGIADNQALTQLHEAIGRRTQPIIAFPRINAAHAAHPAWNTHLTTLRKAGVQLLYGEHIWPLHQPRTQPGRQLPWKAIREAIASGSVR